MKITALISGKGLKGSKAENAPVNLYDGRRIGSIVEVSDGEAGVQVVMEITDPAMVEFLNHDAVKGLRGATLGELS